MNFRIPAEHLDPTRLHHVTFLFEARNSNPNGDPDRENAPRIDPDTMHGITTDVSLKRKIRDHVMATKMEDASVDVATRRYDIFIRNDHSLNGAMRETAQAFKIEKPTKKNNTRPMLRDAYVRRFFDIRMFGAVLNTGEFNAGQMQGPVQVTFAVSVGPIISERITITRQAYTEESKFEAQQEKGGQTEMGAKHVVPYALYRAALIYNPLLAPRDSDGQLMVTEDDLAALYDALVKMFETTRSASRPDMSTRKVIIATPQVDQYTPAHEIAEAVEVRAQLESPRAFSDYDVTHRFGEMADRLLIHELP